MSKKAQPPSSSPKHSHPSILLEPSLLSADAGNLASEAKRVGLHALLLRLIESFPPKRIALRDGSTGRRQGAERAHCLQRYLLKAMHIIEPLLEEGHAGAQALQLVIVRDFLRLDLADFAVWFKRVGQMLGFPM